MRWTHLTFDVFGPVLLVFLILLAVGVIPFTAPWVAAVILLSQCHFTLKWDL